MKGGSLEPKRKVGETQHLYPEALGKELPPDLFTVDQINAHKQAITKLSTFEPKALAKSKKNRAAKNPNVGWKWMLDQMKASPLWNSPDGEFKAERDFYRLCMHGKKIKFNPAPISKGNVSFVKLPTPATPKLETRI